jgi:hypothetical protein
MFPSTFRRLEVFIAVVDAGWRGLSDAFESVKSSKNQLASLVNSGGNT